MVETEKMNNRRGEIQGVLCLISILRAVRFTLCSISFLCSTRYSIYQSQFHSLSHMHRHIELLEQSIQDMIC